MLPRVLLLCSATSWRLYLMVFELDWPFVLHWRSSSLLFEPLEAGVKVRKMPLKNVWFDLKCFCLLSSSCCCGWLVKRDRCPSHISPLDLWDFLFVKSFQNFSCIAPEMGGERSNVGHYLLSISNPVLKQAFASMHPCMDEWVACTPHWFFITAWRHTWRPQKELISYFVLRSSLVQYSSCHIRLTLFHDFTDSFEFVFLIVTQSKPTTGTSGL